MMPRSRRANVVLPLPLSPATTVTDGSSPDSSSEMLSTATVWLRRNIPTPKTFVTLRASSNAVIVRFRTGGRRPSVPVAPVEVLGQRWGSGPT